MFNIINIDSIKKEALMGVICDKDGVPEAVQSYILWPYTCSYRVLGIDGSFSMSYRELKAFPLKDNKLNSSGQINENQRFELEYRLREQAEKELRLRFGEDRDD